MVNYKRQSGGRGQYAFAYGTITPLEDRTAELEYVSAVTGGSIPANYIKSVQKVGVIVLVVISSPISDRMFLGSTDHVYSRV